MLYFHVMLKKYDMCINADVLPKYPKIGITVGSLLNCRNLNETVLLQSLTTSCWLYTWEQTNSGSWFAANLNMKRISYIFPHPVLLEFECRPHSYFYSKQNIQNSRVYIKNAIKFMKGL